MSRLPPPLPAPPWQVPFYDDSPDDIRRHVLAGERPPVPLGWPRPLAQLVTDCWAEAPTARPSMDKVLDRLRELAP